MKRLLPAAGLLCIFAFEWGLADRHLSQTFDEADHLLAGYLYWTCGDFGVNPEHPPLAKLVAALPVVLMRVQEPSTPCGESRTTTAEDFEQGAMFLFANNADRVLGTARRSVSVFALGTAILVFLWGRRLGGHKAGLLALAFFVFEPTVVAHSALVTTDMAVSCFLLLACWAWGEAAEKPGRIVVTGLAAGLCLASKHSGLLVFPILALLAPFLWTGSRRAVKAAGALALVAVIALVVLWGSYGFRYAPRVSPHHMTQTLSEYIARSSRMTGVRPISIVESLDRLHLLPEAYLYGAANVLFGSAAGGHTYLFGTLRPTGVWYYFPSALLVKWTLGFLGMLAIGLFGLGRASRPTRLLLLPPAFYLLVTMSSRMNIGVRHVLPIFPFLCILLGVQAALLLEKRVVLVFSLLAVHAVSSLRAFPDYIAYSNEFVGGPQNTYRVLSDSNADWGQGLKEAKAYLKANHIRECALAYFGTAEPHAYGLSCRVLPGAPPRPMAPQGRIVEGTLIVSAGLLAGIPWGPGSLNPFEPLREVKPKTVLGGSLLVYEGRFDLPLLAALTHVERARGLASEGRRRLALAEAREAAALAPEDPFVARTLGKVLAEAGEEGAAQEAFADARRLAQEHGPAFHERLLRSLEEEP